MSLSDREYMYETYEEKCRARQEKEDKRNRKNELWRLYAKKHKTRKDRQRIKELEYYNLHEDEFKENPKMYNKKNQNKQVNSNNKKNDISIGQVFLYCLLVIVFVIYIYMKYVY